MAMPQELKGVCCLLKNVKKHSSCHYSAKTATGAEMVLLVTGLGAIQTASTIIDYTKDKSISSIIMLGVGGGLRLKQKVGDLIIGKRIVAYDSKVSFDEGQFLVKPGEYLANAKAAESHDHHIYSDASLVGFCSKCKGAVAADVLSGGEIVLSSSRKKELADDFKHAQLVEMEGVGLALAAKRLNIPFVLAKAIADRQIDQSKNTIMDDFQTNFARAISSSAQVARLWQQEK